MAAESALERQAITAEQERDSAEGQELAEKAVLKVTVHCVAESSSEDTLSRRLRCRLIQADPPLPEQMLAALEEMAGRLNLWLQQGASCFCPLKQAELNFGPWGLGALKQR